MLNVTKPIELSLVIPCLNEERTLGACIRDAQRAIQDNKLSAEIMIADNGSTDASVRIAEQLGAKIVSVFPKGYGSALKGGIAASQGKYIIHGDADGSHDFRQIPGFLDKLREGYDLVIGCRFPRGGGRIMPGAMPWKNQWIGNPFLSMIGRLLFPTTVTDFHCGYRGFTRNAFDRMGLQTNGMEFASELIAKGVLSGMKITEIPIVYYPDGRDAPSHLRPWRDGCRHLYFMFCLSAGAFVADRFRSMGSNIAAQSEESSGASEAVKL